MPASVTARNDRGARVQAIPASLHRAEFRRHNNPPMTVSLQGTGTSKPCSEDSLWQRHAISRLDEGETLHVVETVAGYNLLVDGEVRTRVTRGSVGQA